MADLLATIRESVIGDDAVIDGPWGPRPLVYADYTASGRALTFLEDSIRAEVLPTYANTHTEATLTGRQTTALREDAREVIGHGVRARRSKSGAVSFDVLDRDGGAHASVQ